MHTHTNTYTSTLIRSLNEFKTIYDDTKHRPILCVRACTCVHRIDNNITHPMLIHHSHMAHTGTHTRTRCSHTFFLSSFILFSFIACVAASSFVVCLFFFGSFFRYFSPPFFARCICVQLFTRYTTALPYSVPLPLSLALVLIVHRVYITVLVCEEYLAQSASTTTTTATANGESPKEKTR